MAIVGAYVDGRPMPLAVKRLLARARGTGSQPALALGQGWMVEPVLAPRQPLWIWGAGHVGRALVAVLAPLFVRLSGFRVRDNQKGGFGE